MRWVLYLGNARQALYRVGRHDARLVWQMRDGPPAEKPAAWSCRRLAVIVDLMEEEYRLERLPHLGGRDREALWARKRRQLFQDEPYVSVVRLGREKSGRRDDRVLFTAIRDAPRFKRWLESLASWRIAVTGIWSLPRLSAGWKASPLVEGLRVLLYRGGGKIALRQTYHEGGYLVFSRFSPVAGEEEGAQELERTWRYLSRQFQWEAGRAITLQLWVPPGLEDMAKGLVEGLPNSEPAFIGLTKVARTKGWRGEAAALDVPALAAFSLMRRWNRQPCHYRDPVLHAREKRRRLNLALYVGSAALFAVAAGYDTLMERHILQLDEAMRRLRLERQTLAGGPGARAVPEPVAGLDAWQLESLLAFQRKIAAGRIRPESLLTPISSALDRFPAFELVSLGWRRPSPADEESEEEAGIDLSRPPRVMLSVRVSLEGGALRRTVERVERFVALLERDGQVASAHLAASTLPIADDEPASGEVGAVESGRDSAMFTITVDMKAFSSRPALEARD